MLIIIRITAREPEAKETWRAIDESATNAFKGTSFASWEYGGGDLVKGTEKIIKVCPTGESCDRYKIAS